jgi:hypothetical protein
MNYDEPWGWIQPARHALGTLLLEQDRVAANMLVYRKDMRCRPKQLLVTARAGYSTGKQEKRQLQESRERPFHWRRKARMSPLIDRVSAKGKNNPLLSPRAFPPGENGNPADVVNKCCVPGPLSNPTLVDVVTPCAWKS